MAGQTDPSIRQEILALWIPLSLNHLLLFFIYLGGSRIKCNKIGIPSMDDFTHNFVAVLRGPLHKREQLISKQFTGNLFRLWLSAPLIDQGTASRAPSSHGKSTRTFFS